MLFKTLGDFLSKEFLVVNITEILYVKFFPEQISHRYVYTQVQRGLFKPRIESYIEDRGNLLENVLIPLDKFHQKINKGIISKKYFIKPNGEVWSYSGVVIRFKNSDEIEFYFEKERDSRQVTKLLGELLNSR